MAALLRNPRYLAFWLGQVTSVIGNAVSLIALPALILPSRGANAFGLVVASEALAGVLLRWRPWLVKAGITLSVVICAALTWVIANGPVFHAVPTDRRCGGACALIILCTLIDIFVRVRRIQPARTAQS